MSKETVRHETSDGVFSMSVDRRPITKLIGGVVISAILWSGFGCATPPPVTPDVIAETKSADKSQFILGPEDVLEIGVWRSEDLTQKEVVVRPDGKIAMPLIGDVEVSGRTARELAAHIEERLKVYKESPSVSVKVREVNSYFVYVLGDVVRPGKYSLKSNTTVLQAIAMAGGFTPYAAKGNMQVRRTVVGKNGESSEFKIPAHYDQLVSGEGQIKDFVLKTADVLVVPSRAW